MQLRRIIVKLRRFVIFRLLHIDDTPHRLALGLALGLFIAWTPTIGFQMLLVLLLAPAFRANIAVGLPAVWVSNPVTFAPLYFANYWVGQKILLLFTERPALNYSQVVEKLIHYQSIGKLFSQIDEAQFWHKVIDFLWQFGLELWVGSVLIGLCVAIPGYFASYKLIVWYRTHTPRGRLHVLKMLHKRKKKIQSLEDDTKNKNATPSENADLIYQEKKDAEK